MLTDFLNRYWRWAGDALSFGVIVGSVAQWLPSVATLFSLIWTAIMIFESRTFQRLILRRPEVKTGHDA